MRRFFVPIVIAAALVGGALFGRTSVQAEDPKPAGFEYRVFIMDYRDYKEKDDWKEFVEKAGRDELKADADFKGHVLNVLGREGWELVQVLAPKAELTHFYLKRTRRGR